EVLGSLDRFLGALLQRLDRAGVLLLLTSDHGNLEDLSTKSHTRNAVPLAAFGTGASAFRDARSLTDVTPALIALSTQKSASP
ncbi:MAG: peptidase, partial [Rhodothermales bacterium]